MSVNTVFKGDLVEVTLGKETGLYGQGTGSNSAGGGWDTTNGTTDNASVINVGSNLYFAGEVPKNMLVGATVKFYSAAGNFTADHFPTTKRTYYITANTDSTITIQPRLSTGVATGAAADYFIVEALRIPTIETAMTYGTPDDRVKTDQFIGLLNSFALPEPEIDVRKQHIVGMGRDVNVLTSGRETLSGGAFEVNAHNLRWLRYGLGGHTALGSGEMAHRTTGTTILTDAPLNIKDAVATYRAQQYGSTNADDISEVSGTTATGLSNVATNSDFLLGAKTASGSSSTINLATSNYDATHESVGTAGVFKTLSADGASVLYGSYSGASGTTLTGADITSGALARAQTAGAVAYLLAELKADISHGDIRVNVGSTIAGRLSVGEYLQIVDKDTVQIPGADAELPTINKHEIRRIVAIGSASGNDAAYVYVEEPFCLTHTAASCGVDRIIFTHDSSQGSTRRGSPAITSSTGQLHYGIEHTFYGGSTVPTFTIEQSFRRTDATPGADALVRLFSGCKVNSLTCTADTEGEFKISGDYEATRMFTDTESRFATPHRLFENTASTNITRRSSGIAVGGEKPYLFQHITFSAFGSPVLRATNVEFQITNSNTARYYIRGTDGTYSSTDQVSEAATQYATEITEAQREYTLKFQAIVEDDRFFEELRQRKHHINENDMTLTLFKPGSASTRQRATVTLEDYTVVKAEMPVPDDKGPVTANVELVVRHLKVTEHNPYPIL